ncbi:hypothetical protein D3C76_1623030 [compost metagenome]
MVNGINLPGFHDIKQLMLITHGPEDRQNSYRQRLTNNALFQLGKNAIEVVFTMLEQQQCFRTRMNNLPAQLGAN